MRAAPVSKQWRTHSHHLVGAPIFAQEHLVRSMVSLAETLHLVSGLLALNPCAFFLGSVLSLNPCSLLVGGPVFLDAHDFFAGFSVRLHHCAVSVGCLRLLNSCTPFVCCLAPANLFRFAEDCLTSDHSLEGCQVPPVTFPSFKEGR